MAINQFKISFTHPTLSHFFSSNFSSAEQLATLPPVSTLPHCHRRAPISQPHWVVIFFSLSLDSPISQTLTISILFRFISFTLSFFGYYVMLANFLSMYIFLDWVFRKRKRVVKSWSLSKSKVRSTSITSFCDFRVYWGYYSDIDLKLNGWYIVILFADFSCFHFQNKKRRWICGRVWLTAGCSWLLTEV